MVIKMKKEMIVFTVFFICAVLTFSAASVRADAASTSKAWMDWGTFTISGDITWGDKGSQSYAYAEDTISSDKDLQSESGWVDTSASALIIDSYGAAYTSDGLLYEEVFAIVNETTTPWAYADASAYRWGYFTADSNGWVELSANYSLWQALLTDYTGEFPWTSGYAEAGLYLANSDTSVWDQNTAELENTVCGIATQDDGTLTVAVWFDAGNAGQFEAWVYNEAEVQVPEPATICLLGLGALSLLRRKK
jgi:hypothetical protein